MNLSEVSNVKRAAEIAQEAADAAHFAQYERLIHKLACDYMPRAMAMGMNMDHDDLFQSLCVIYAKCKAGFDESLGYKFTTYLQNACYWEFNRMAQIVGRQRRTLSATSIDELPHKVGDVFDAKDPYAAFSDPDQRSPEDAVSIEQQVGCDLKRLGHQGRTAVTLLLNPTVDLEEAFRGHQAQLETVHAKVPQDITLAFILDYMKVPYSARRRIREEIRNVYGVSVPISGRV